MNTLPKSGPLPRGWDWGQWSERTTAMRLLPRRVRVLLACEWARSVLPLFERRYPDDPRPREAIEAAEAWVIAPAAAARADAAAAAARADAADAAARAARAADAAAAAAAAAAARAAAARADAARAAARAAADAAAADAARVKWQWLYATYRHARGPEGLAFDPAWRTTTAAQIASGIFESMDFSAMPILADALQDAGCDHAPLMDHLQADRGEWTRADWCLWNLLGLGEDCP